MKGSDFSDMIRKLSRALIFVTGLLVVVILSGLFIYATISLLPMILSFATSSFLEYASTVTDIIVAAGPGAVFLGVLFGLVGYRLIKWLYMTVMAACHKVAVYFSLEEALDTDGKTLETKTASKKTRIMFAVICLVIIGLFVWQAIVSETNSSDETMDDATTITSEMMTYEGPYPTLDELSLTDGLDSVNLTEWEQANTNLVFDSVDAIVAELSDAPDFSQHVYFGTDISGDMTVVPNTLLEYVTLDMDESVLSNMVAIDADGNWLSGVSYDMLFEFVTADDDTVIWRQSDSMAGLSGAKYLDRVNMICSDGILYVSNAPEEPGAELEYAYTGQDAGDMSTHKATIGTSLMDMVTVNHSVSDVMAYTRTTQYGMDYYWTGSQLLERGDYVGTLTKSVLLECVADGSYEMTVVYSVNGDEPGGEMVFRVNTDTTDVTVSVPDASEVRYITDNT